MLPDKWQKRYLELAKHIAGWSKDSSTRVGAVLVDRHNRIISLGFNGFPQGILDDSRLEDRELKYKMILHAEQNSILFAQRSLIGATLYVWPFMPCSRCAAVIIQTGLREVVAPQNDNPRWQEDFKLAQEMFWEAGVTVTLVEVENEQSE
jgi:dCMP deaminase